MQFNKTVNIESEAAHYQAALEWIAANATSATSSPQDACDLRAVLDDIYQVAGDGLALCALVAPPVKAST